MVYVCLFLYVLLVCLEKTMSRFVCLLLLHEPASLYTFLFVCVFACVCLGLLMLDVPLPVMMHQHVDDFFKQVMLLWAKVASSDLVNSLFQLRDAVVVLLSVVSKREHKQTHINKNTSLLL